MSVPIFFINLDRSEARRLKMEDQLRLQGLAFRRVPAVDGRALPPHVLRSFTSGWSPFVWGARLLPGEVGCALSYLKVLRTMIDEEIPQAVILEDDVVLSEGFAEQLNALAVLNPGLTFLHGSTFQGPGTDEGRVLVHLGAHRLMESKLALWGNCGLLVSLDYARARVRQAFPLIVPMDVHWLLDGLPIFQRVEPPLVTLTECESTIGPRAQEVPFGQWRTQPLSVLGYLPIKLCRRVMRCVLLALRRLGWGPYSPARQRWFRQRFSEVS